MNNFTKLSNKLSHRIIESVRDCLSSKRGKTLELMDGSLVRLTPEIAEKFINIHDELKETNQESFRLMLVENKKTFEGIVAFCKEKK